MNTKSTTLLLTGIDGGNLLAFLAALGALRVLSEDARLAVRMSWRISGGAIRPQLHFQQPMDQAALLDVLANKVCEENGDHPSLQWEIFGGKEPKPCPDNFINARKKASMADRLAADFLSAIGSDLFRAEGGSSDTPLRVPREDYLLGNIRQILKDTEVSHLRKTLFSPWVYDDPVDNRSLRFDPADDARYALRWNNPSGDPNKKKRGGMLGANRLALEALPLFTSVIIEDPRSQQGFALATIGCARDHEGWIFSWNLWAHPCTLDVCRSVLGFAMHDQSDSRRDFTARGILAAYYCRRLTIGKTRVFTPSQQIF